MDLINKPCTLDFSNYIPSLLSKAIKDNTITKDVLKHIEIQFITLLHKQMKKFTLNESSSLPVEAAENILHSIMYTTGIELQSEPNLLKQIEILSTVSVDKIFNNGIKRLKNMLSKAKFYHSQVKKTLLPIELITYTDTLDQGLKNFFDKYDLYFDAHNTILCLDYPLASDELNMIGLQRILDYLKKVYFSYHLQKIPC